MDVDEEELFIQLASMADLSFDPIGGYKVVEAC